MIVLGLNGSPRRGGNTQILLERFLEGVRSAGGESIYLSIPDLDIAPCCEKEYENVDDKGLSIVRDDIHVIFEAISKSDAVVLASPIFFGSMTAQAKAMIDRFQCVWISANTKNKKVFEGGRKGVFICVEATDRRDFFENASQIARHFFKTIDADRGRELLFSGLERKGEVAGRKDLLARAEKAGRELVLDP